jgi:hypothetical protein
LVKAALFAVVLFAIYYANWSYGWLTPEAFNYF